jgi:hypothetical protein
MNFHLEFDGLNVGFAVHAIEHQGTWIGQFNAFPSSADVGDARVREFITLCRNWHERIDAGEDPSADEFDAFQDIISSEKWWAIDETGCKSRIVEAPVFVGNDVSWRFD